MTQSAENQGMTWRHEEDGVRSCWMLLRRHSGPKIKQKNLSVPGLFTTASNCMFWFERVLHRILFLMSPWRKKWQTVLVQLLVLWSLSASICPFLPQGGSSVLTVADNVMILSHCSYFPRWAILTKPNLFTPASLMLLIYFNFYVYLHFNDIKKCIYVIKISIKRVRRSRGETVALSISRFTIAS